MNARRLNFVLWAAAGICLAAALVVVMTGVTLPLDAGAPVRRTGAAASGPATRAAEERWADGDWSRPLRGPLTGSSSATAPSTHAPGAPADADAQASAPLTLLGTIGDSLAIVGTPDGSVATVAPLDHVGDALVTAIRPSEIDVQIGGRTVTIRRAAGPALPALTPGTPDALAGPMVSPTQ